MAIWVVPMIYGDVAEPRSGGGTKELDTAWYDARATFYGDIHGGGTQDGACGYGDPNKEGYGLATTALSTALFNDGYTCGACYEIMCARDSQWCLPGSINITATNFCPPSYSKTQDQSCNPPNKHFELSQPMFLKIAKDKAKNVPLRYRRVPCAKTGGVKFETKRGPQNHLTILPYNVGGAGDIKAVEVKGSKTGWIPMTKIFGQIWTSKVVLTGQGISLRIMTSDGVSKDFINVIPPNWGFGQTFDGKINF
ncbi:hypothetical protein EUTSA_v10028214mg [Eutrema salsugineum]|uniref:Expansin n=2 Tax=Eutrema salsugineum TaxID=72664 RepID=V4M4B7_EUTSA|nr:hypothetical protein EUTSA_v10028214mg [Eutrema salsugineum]